MSVCFSCPCLLTVIVSHRPFPNRSSIRHWCSDGYCNLFGQFDIPSYSPMHRDLVPAADVKRPLQSCYHHPCRAIWKVHSYEGTKVIMPWLCIIISTNVTVLSPYRLIFAQILGAYIACLIIYVQYHNLIEARLPFSLSLKPQTTTEARFVNQPIEAGLVAKGEYDSVMFTSTGPGGIFAFYALPTANLGYVFLNEFVSVGLSHQHCLTYSKILLSYAGLCPRHSHICGSRPYERVHTSCCSPLDHWFCLVRYLLLYHHISSPWTFVPPSRSPIPFFQRRRYLGLRACRLSRKCCTRRRWATRSADYLGQAGVGRALRCTCGAHEHPCDAPCRCVLRIGAA